MSTQDSNFASGWRKFTNLFLSSSVPTPSPQDGCNEDSPVLQALEDRILYDASPLGAVFADVNEAPDLMEAIDPAEAMSIDAKPDPVDWLSQKGEALAEVNEKTKLNDFRSSVVEKQLIVIDESVDGFDKILDNLYRTKPGIQFDILWLDQKSDGLMQITEHLEGDQRYGAMHLVSHGENAQLQLGNTIINGENLDKYQSELQSWTDNFSRDADLLIYGCEVAADADGEDFASRIAKYTKMDVAASDDLTGFYKLGGDWNFEFHVGEVESDLFLTHRARFGFTGVLATISVTTTDDVIDDTDNLTSLREAIIEANETAGEDTIILAPGSYSFVIDGQGENEGFTGDLDVTDDLTILGSDTETTIIDGSGLDRVFDIHNGTFTVSNLTIVGGDAGPSVGGGLYVHDEAQATLRDVTVANNTALSGGGIYNSGQLALENVQVNNNIATFSGSGGVANAGSLNAFNLDLSDNASNDDSAQFQNVSSGNSFITNMTIQGDEAANFDANTITVSEGEKVILSEENLLATGADANPESVNYRVSDVVGGQFELIFEPGRAVTRFTHADIANGYVAFVHDGLEAAPSYNVDVSGVGVTEGVSRATIGFSSIDEASVVSEISFQTMSEDEWIVFNAANGNLIEFNDPDSNRSKDVTLIVDNGTIHLSQLTHLTVMWGANGSEKVTVRGLEKDINAALDGMVYRPDAEYFGTEKMRVWSEETEVYNLNVDPTLKTYLRFNQIEDLGKDDSPEFSNPGNVLGAEQVYDEERYEVLRFNEGDQVEIPGLMGENSSVTLSAWVNLDAGETDSTVVSLGGNVNLMLDKSGSGVTGMFWNGTGFSETTTDTFLAGTGWHHVAYTVDDSTGEQTIYIDGAIAGQSTHNGTINYFLGDTTRVGTDGIGIAGSEYVGSLDEIRVYGRALDEVDISHLATDPATEIERVNINIKAVLDDIDINVPITQNIIEDGSLVFSSDAGNPLYIDSVDGFVYDVTISVENGTLTLPPAGNMELIEDADDGTGVTTIVLESPDDSESGTGSDDGGNITPDMEIIASGSTIRIFGNADDVNAALDGLEYTPDAEYSGNDTLTMTAIDANAPDPNDPTLRLNLTFDDPDNIGADNSPSGEFNAVASGTHAFEDIERGNVVSLNGYTDYFDIDVPDFQPSSATLSGWVNLSESSGESEFISLGDNMVIRLDDPELGVHGFYFNGVDYTAGTYSGVNIGGTGWQHIAYVVDSENQEQTLYINGVLAAQTHLPDEIVYGLGDGISIGHHGNDSSQARLLAGTIDDIRVYERALDDREILNVFLDYENAPQAAKEVNIVVEAVDDPMSLLNNSISVAEGETVAITAANLLATDPDTPDKTFTFEVSNVEGGQFELTSDSGAAVSSFTQSQIDIGEVVFVHDGVNDMPKYDLSVSDGSTSIETLDNSIAFTNLNDAPYNMGDFPSTVTVTEDAVSALDLTSINLADNDYGGGPVTLTFTTTSGGILNAESTDTVTVTGSETDQLTLTGTLDDLNAYMADPSLIDYSNTNGNRSGAGADSIIVQVNDNEGSGEAALGTISVDITAINDDPFNTGGMADSFTVLEDVSSQLDFSQISVTDVDSDSAELTIILETNNGGMISLTDADGIAIGGNGTQAATLTGTAANLNGYLADATRITYTGGTNVNGNGIDSISVYVTDNGNVGLGGGQAVLLGTANINITPVNDAPIDLTPDEIKVNENSDPNSSVTVAQLAAVDVDSNEVITYSIVGGADAGRFTLEGENGDQLTLNGIVDFETQSSYEVTVRATDAGGLTYDETMTINVDDINEAPDSISIDQTLVINENTNTFNGHSVGTLTATDNDAAEVFTYAIVGGQDAGSFTIGGENGDQLIFNDGIVNFERQSSYTVTVQVTDIGGLTFERTLTLQVNDINEAPTGFQNNLFSANHNEDTSGGIVVGQLEGVDPDRGDTLTYEIVGGRDAANFTLTENNELVFDDGILDSDRQAIYAVTVEITDSEGLTFFQDVIVNVSIIAPPPTTTLVSDSTDSFSVTLPTYDVGSTLNGNTTSFTVTTAPESGFIQVGGQTLAQGESFTLDDVNSGRVTFEYSGNNFAGDQFQLTVADDQGNTNTETVSVTSSNEPSEPVESMAEPTTTVASSSNNSGGGGFNPNTAASPAAAVSLLEYVRRIATRNGNKDQKVTGSNSEVEDKQLSAIVEGLCEDQPHYHAALLGVLLKSPNFGNLELSDKRKLQYAPNGGFAGQDEYTLFENNGKNLVSEFTFNVESKKEKGDTTDADSGSDENEATIVQTVTSDSDTTPIEILPDDSDGLKVHEASSVVNGTIIEFLESLTGQPVLDLTESGVADVDFADMSYGDAAKNSLRLILENTTPTNGANKAHSEQPNYPGLVFDAQQVWNELTTIELLGAGVEKLVDPLPKFAVTVNMSEGYMLWSLQNGLLTGSAISSSTPWQILDPRSSFKTPELQA